MKRLIFTLIIMTQFLLSDTSGSIEKHQNTIEILQEKQKAILKNLRNIDKVLSKYDSFAKSYLKKLREIIASGATCIIAEEEYLLEERGDADMDILNRLKGMVDDCYSMIFNRTAAITNLKVEIEALKKKVEKVKKLRKINVNEKQTIIDYILKLKNDIAYLEKHADTAR